MKKVLALVALLLVAGVGILVVPSRQPAVGVPWRPISQIVFLGFTNPVPNAPATNAWFGLRDIPGEPTTWVVSEVSYREGGKWRRVEALSYRWFKWVYPVPSGYMLSAAVPVPSTNVPLRVVVEMKRSLPAGSKPARGWMHDEYSKLRRRWMMRWYRDQPARWSEYNQSYPITNEFNFPTGVVNSSTSQTR